MEREIHPPKEREIHLPKEREIHLEQVADFTGLHTSNKAGQLARSGFRVRPCGYGLGVDDDQLADYPSFSETLKRRVIVAGLPLRRQAFNPNIISGLASVRV